MTASLVCAQKREPQELGRWRPEPSPPSCPKDTAHPQVHPLVPQPVTPQTRLLPQPVGVGGTVKALPPEGFGFPTKTPENGFMSLLCPQCSRPWWVPAETTTPGSPSRPGRRVPVTPSYRRAT